MTQDPTGRPPGARWAVLEAGAHVTTSRPAHHGRTNHDTPGGDSMTSTTNSTPPVPALDIIDGPRLRTERHDDGTEWPHRAYRVRITHDGRTMETPWKQGMGIAGDPEAHDVIGCLLMDAQGIEDCAGFPDWAEQYGYDPDSIAAREMYEQVRRLSDDLADLLTRRVMVALLDDENATYGAAPRFALAWAAAFGEAAAGQGGDR